MIRRHFLDWDAPVSAKVADYLLAEAVPGTVDLSEVLVLVPTRQAGRRLRQLLLARCAARNAGLLPPRIETPAFLIAPAAGERAASATEELCCWLDTLLGADLSDFPDFFPVAPVEKDFSWALRTGRMLQALRERLVEGGHLLADVARLGAAELEEAERWRDLAALEERYLDRMAAEGSCDSCGLQIERAGQPMLPEGIERVVVAAVVDPLPLALRALEKLSGRMDVEVLVHAPAAKAPLFDGWGRPLAGKWRETHIDLDQAEERIHLAGSPQAQCARVMDILAAEQHRYPAGSTGLGVADAELAPALVRELRQTGLQAYDPAGVRLRDHVLYSLLENIAELLREGGFETLTALLRHADVLARFARIEKWPVALLLEALDRLQNEYLPQTAADAMQRLTGQGEAAFVLRGAFSFVHRLLEDFEKRPLDEAVERLLAWVYEGRPLDLRRRDDRDFEKAAARVRGVLEDCRVCRRLLESFSPAGRMQLFLNRLAGFSFYPEHDDAAIELDGWLELPWLDMPLLVIHGMNEGMVPSSRLGDPLLPDSLCKKLGIRHNDSLFARDACLLSGLAASRRKEGRLYLIVGKSSSRGEPLLPSRLLFMVGDNELPGRATLLFREIEEPRPAVARSTGFVLEPGQAEKRFERIEKLPVTAFRDYLACPFRFFLKHVLGMETMDDRKDEMDSLDFGSFAHRALEFLGSDSALRDCSDAARIARRLADFVEEEGRRRFGASPPLQITMQLTSLVNRLEAAAREHVRMTAAGWQIERVEVEREIRVNGIVIRGRIDRLDRHAESGRFRIVDYKTGEKATLPEKTHLGTAGEGVADYALFEVKGKVRRWIDLQLPLYFLLLAADGVTPENCEAGYFNLPKAVSETGYASWEAFGPHQLQQAELCMQGVLAAIAQNTFWPPAAKVANDSFGGLFYDDPLLVFREPRP